MEFCTSTCNVDAGQALISCIQSIEKIQTMTDVKGKKLCSTFVMGVSEWGESNVVS